MKKKMRKFEEGGNVSPKTTRLPSELSGYSDAERRAMSIGFKRGTPDYLGAVGVFSEPRFEKDTSYVNALDKTRRIGLEPGSEDFNLAMQSQMRNARESHKNKAMEKVKSTAITAGKRLMDMTPQGRVIKDVVSTARKYPRYSEGESSFEQEMGMKKGGKVSSASKRADGIATKGKTRGRIV